MLNNVAWTLSGFGDEIDPDPKIQCAVLQALGASHIEVRSAWHKNIVDLSSTEIEKLAQIIDGQGMRTSAIASPIGKISAHERKKEETERLKRILDRAQRLNAKYVRIFSFYRNEGETPADIRDLVIDRIGEFADLAQDAEIVLVHENEKDIYGDIPARVLDILKSIASPNLRMAWDNANFVQVGVRPYTEGYALLRGYIEYFQVKDARESDGAVVPAGEGAGELDQTIKALAADNYSGFASLEPHLAEAHELGGFSGPRAFGAAARAFRAIAEKYRVELM